MSVNGEFLAAMRAKMSAMRLDAESRIFFAEVLREAADGFLASGLEDDAQLVRQLADEVAAPVTTTLPSIARPECEVVSFGRVRFSRLSAG